MTIITTYGEFDYDNEKYHIWQSSDGDLFHVSRRQAKDGSKEEAFFNREYVVGVVGL